MITSRRPSWGEYANSTRQGPRVQVYHWMPRSRTPLSSWTPAARTQGNTAGQTWSGKLAKAAANPNRAPPAESPQRNRQGERLGAHPRTQRLVDGEVNALVQEMHRAVPHQELRPLRVRGRDVPVI